ncbi:hypothetical protein ACFV2U_11565 [Streptomyces sp. NPDC059697]|uniref:hypothetical protein n=1 Tax=Streptomyces sp. NPDC059697 TaxID=3346912 RepID=UPI0036B1E317
MNPSIKRAILAIPDEVWRQITYPTAVPDPETGELISDAEVAEIPAGVPDDAPDDPVHADTALGLQRLNDQKLNSIHTRYRVRWAKALEKLAHDADFDREIRLRTEWALLADTSGALIVSASDVMEALGLSPGPRWPAPCVSHRSSGSSTPTTRPRSAAGPGRIHLEFGQWRDVSR